MMKRIALAAAIAGFAAAPALAQDRDFGLEIIATDKDGVLHYAHNQEDDRSAAIWTDGEDPDSARFMEGREADAAYEEAIGDAGITPVEDGDLAIKIFGVSVYASEDGEADNARVVVNAPGGKQQVVVNASDRHGEDGAAHIVIKGADEDGVRDFIDDIDEAPRSMKRDMEEALGL